MRTKLTCIFCPIGCTLDIEVEDGEVRVKGNRCPRGCDYARQELLEPRRVLFTVVRVDSREYRVAAVRSRGPVPKEKIRLLLKRLSEMRIPAGWSEGKTFEIEGFEFIVTRM